MSAQNVIKQRETKKRFTRKIKDGLQKKKKKIKLISRKQEMSSKTSEKVKPIMQIRKWQL